MSAPLKVALVGSAPSSKMLAPFHDESWQIWACSPSNADLPSVDLWFELHADLGWPESRVWSAPYLAWINQQKFPVYAQDQAFIPRALTFPHQELMARFGTYFFTSTFAWMIGFALMKGAKEIGLFGIDMATDLEYTRQRPGFQHFLVMAQRAGVRIVAPNESDILQPPPLYGYDMATPLGRKLAVRRREIELRVADLTAQRKDIDYHLAHLTGALDNLDYVQSIWSGHQDHADDRRHAGTPVRPLFVPASVA